MTVQRTQAGRYIEDEQGNLEPDSTDPATAERFKDYFEDKAAAAAAASAPASPAPVMEGMSNVNDRQ